MAAEETETQEIIDDGLDQIRDEVAKGVRTIGDVARGAAATIKDAIIEGTWKTFAPGPAPNLVSEEPEQKEQDARPVAEIMQETGNSIQADLRKIFGTTKKEEKEE